MPTIYIQYTPPSLSEALRRSKIDTKSSRFPQSEEICEEEADFSAEIAIEHCITPLKTVLSVLP